jgi:tetratricopeptide (TPR) repeat protein
VTFKFIICAVLTQIYQAIFNRPELPELFVLRGRAYAALHDIKSAISNLTQAVVLFDAAGTSHLEENTPIALELASLHDVDGMLKLQQAVFDEALQSFNAALSCNSHYHVALFHRSLVYVSQQRFDRALNDLQQYCNMERNNIRAIVMLSRVHKRLGNSTAAAIAIQTALGIDPNDTEAHNLNTLYRGAASELYHEASSALLANDYDSAIQILTRAIDQDPLDVRFFSRRGVVYRTIGRHDLAVKDLMQAVTLSGGNKLQVKQLVITYNELGVELYEAKNYSKALVFFTLAIENFPDMPCLYVNRGDVHRDLRDLPSALADYTQAYELNPRDKDVCIRLGLLHDARGLTYFDNKDYFEAVAAFSLAIKFLPHVAAYWNHRGLARIEIRSFQDAASDFAQALKLDPSSDIALSRICMLNATSLLQSSSTSISNQNGHKRSQSTSPKKGYRASQRSPERLTATGQDAHLTATEAALELVKSQKVLAEENLAALRHKSQPREAFNALRSQKLDIKTAGASLQRPGIR